MANTAKVFFEYTPPLERLTIDATLLRTTLGRVRDQLLSHEINGGGKKLNMDIVCQDHACGTAACIGGWASLLLLGFESSKVEEQRIVNNLFETLTKLDLSLTRKRYATGDGSKYGPLEQLFYRFAGTDDYNKPNVAATAIQRYLDGKQPWVRGIMPDVLPYKRQRKAKSK